MNKRYLALYKLVLLFILIFAFEQILTSSELSIQNHKSVHFYFVQITDTHFGQKNQLKWTKKVVQAINELPIKIEFVIHTGDITYDKVHDSKLWRKADSILEKIEAPVHYIPGNHDILSNNLEITLDSYKKKFGDLSYSAEYRGVIFIYFYDDPFINSFAIDEYDPLEWIQSTLKQAEQRPIIIFHHTPPFASLTVRGFQGGWPQEKLCKWEKIIGSYNVRAIITGHHHRDSHHWLGNTPLYVSTSTAAFPGRPATFRVYEYKNGKIGYWTQYIEPKKNIIQRLIKKLK